MIDIVCSGLEMFLIKRKIMGPSWLSISKFSSCTAFQRVRLVTDKYVALLDRAMFTM